MLCRFLHSLATQFGPQCRVKNRIGRSAKSLSGLFATTYIVGDTGLEPEAPNSEDTETTRLAKIPSPNATIYENTSLPDPVEKLAEVWDTLSPSAQKRIAALVNKITSTSKTKQQSAAEKKAK